MIAWRDLRGPPRSGPLRCVAPAPPHQRLHRPGDARASPHGEPPGAADRRTGRARRTALRRRPGPARSRVPAAAARTAGDPRAPSLPRATRRPRSPRRSASRPARPALDSITPIAPCGPPSRRTLGPRSGRSIGMTQQRDIERLLDHWFSDGPDQAPDRVVDIVADRIERQPQRPAWRLHWRHPRERLRARSRSHRGGRPDRGRRRLQPPARPARPGSAARAAPSPRPPARQPTPTPTATAVASAVSDVATRGRRRLAAGIAIQPAAIRPADPVDLDVPGGWTAASTCRGHRPCSDDAGHRPRSCRPTALCRDSCRWNLARRRHAAQHTATIVVGRVVDDLVAALQANASTGRRPEPVTVGGFDGQRSSSSCRRTTSCRPRRDPTGLIYGRSAHAGSTPGPDSRWRCRSSTSTARLITSASARRGTSGASRATAQPIVDVSFELTP